MSSASVRVEKATSDLLIGPDWTMNMDICDSINLNHWDAKDVIKAVKKRLQHRNSNVHLLALTLLETMVKNCGDYLHFQIAERGILQEMTKIVKKKTDMNVRDKILTLLDSWQEAFGGPSGKHPQYYWAYDDLRRSGVSFPRRSPNAAPILIPPETHPSFRDAQVGYRMPIHSSQRLDEAMASDIENLSLSSLESMRNVMEVLADILQAVNPSDRMAVRDELIVDLTNQCRSNQKKLMQMLTSTGDEDLLDRGLELNDNLQNLLAKHDAIASGSALPSQIKDTASRPIAIGESSPKQTTQLIDSTTPSVSVVMTTHIEEENEEEEDDFARLARRHSKTSLMPSSSVSNGTVNESVPSNTAQFRQSDQIGSTSNALAVMDNVPIKTTKEQDIMELLSITLSTAAPQTPAQTYPENQPHVTLDSYVVPWAQKPQAQPSQAQYPPPPWAVTPGFINSQKVPSYVPMQGTMQQHNSFSSRGKGVTTNTEGTNSSNWNLRNHTGGTHKPFVPLNRLFEDLNVLGNSDGTGRPSGIGKK